MKSILVSILVLLSFASNGQTIQILCKDGKIVSTGYGFSTTGSILKIDTAQIATLSDVAQASIPQTLVLSGNSLSISGGNTITLPNGGGGSFDTTGQGLATRYYVNNVYIPSPLWSNIQSKPSSFPPSAHTHSPSDLTSGGATTGQALVYNGSMWAAATLSGSGTPQTLSVSGSSLTISGGNTVTLPSSGGGSSIIYQTVPNIKTYVVGTVTNTPNVGVDYNYPTGSSRFALPNGEDVLTADLDGNVLSHNSYGFSSTPDSFFTAIPVRNGVITLLTKPVRDTFDLVFENSQGLTYSSGVYTTSSNDGNWTTNHTAYSIKYANLSGKRVRISMMFDGTTRNAVLGFSTTSAYVGKTGMIAGFWFDAGGITKIVANGSAPSVPLLFPANNAQVGLTHNTDGTWLLEVNEGDGNGWRPYVSPFPSATSTVIAYPVLSVEGSTTGIAKNLKIEFLP